MDSTATAVRIIEGVAELGRGGRLRFPTEDRVADGHRSAAPGSDGFVGSFVGPGRRVRLGDGVEWRIESSLASDGPGG